VGEITPGRRVRLSAAISDRLEVNREDRTRGRIFGWVSWLYVDAFGGFARLSVGLPVCGVAARESAFLAGYLVV
jgi:hypothetical protein